MNFAATKARTPPRFPPGKHLPSCASLSRGAVESVSVLQPCFTISMAGPAATRPRSAGPPRRACPSLSIAGLVILLTFVVAGTARTQPAHIRFSALTVQDGLPHGTVTAILKDRQGFMWFGTVRGVARYDGYSMRTYQPSLTDAGGFRGLLVYAMLEDRAGFIWIATVGHGLNRLDPRTENVVNFSHDPADPRSLSHNDVYALCEDRSGTIWVGTLAGLDRFDPDTQSFLHVHPLPTEEQPHRSRQVVAIAADPADSCALWVGTWGDGIFRFTTNGGVSTHYRRVQRDPTSAGAESIRFLVFSRTEPGVLWVGTLDGLRKFDTIERRVVKIYYRTKEESSISSSVLRCAAEDRRGRLWLGTSGGGLNLFDPKSETAMRFEHDPLVSSSIVNDNVLSLYIDPEGEYWAGTRAGVSLFVDPAEQFMVYQHSPTQKNSLSNDFVYGLCEDRHGDLWIATEGGLNRLEQRTGQFTAFVHDPNVRGSLATDAVRTVYQDRNGDLWAGEVRGVLQRLDRAGNSFRTMELPDQPGEDSQIRAILETSAGQFLVGSPRGLFVVDRLHWTYRRFDLHLPETDAPVDPKVFSLCEDRNGRIWIGTKGNGVIRYDPATLRSVVFRGDSSALTRQPVNFIGLDRGGRVWIAADEGGLLRFDGDDRGFSCVMDHVGVPENTVYGFLEDARGRFWITTAFGLYQLDLNTRRLRMFGLRQGMPAMECNSRAFCATRSGKFFVGTTNGLVSFSPTDIPDNVTVPPVYVTRVRSFEQDLPTDTAATYLHRLVVPGGGNSLSFEFAALSYRDPKANRFAYRLEGLQVDWVDAGTRRYAAYTNLAPGDYVFRVKGSNEQGIWNEAGVRLAVHIERPWWSTWWAFALYGLSVFGVTGIVYRSHLNRLRLRHRAESEVRERERLEELDRVKSRFFSNLSHEFRTPLTLILGPARDLVDKIEDEGLRDEADLIQRSAAKLGRLVDELLDIAKIEVGEMKLHACPADLVSAVREAALPFAAAAERKGTTFTVPAGPHPVCAYIDREKLDKILTNLFSNALKFTPHGGRVEIAVGADEVHRKAWIEVRDSGIGIPREEVGKIFDRFYQVDASHTRPHEGTGIGLALTKELVELHHGAIAVESEEGMGSTFRVEIPLGKDHLRPEEICDDAASESPRRSMQKPMPSESGADLLPGHSDIHAVPRNGLPLLLLVEDNADVRAYVRKLLGADFEMAEACDGEEGLRVALERIPDLIILDVMMPRLDGFDACRRLRSDSRTSHIPVLMLTAKATLNDKVAGLDAGADEYLVKPFEPAELHARIRSLIEQRRRIHEHYRQHGFVDLSDKSITSVDQQFLQAAAQVIRAHISDSGFSVEAFARQMGVSRSLLLKKLEALIGLSPSDLIRKTRLDMAAELLALHTGTISEVALDVGFSNPSYFAECFRKEFGCTPREYVHHRRGDFPHEPDRGQRPELL